MNIGIIDADLIGRKKHRFPNLACEKISAYHKLHGDNVTLLMNYDDLASYDKVIVSKVFTDTPVPASVLIADNVTFGGTGFYYDKADPLPIEVEHIKPDYHLYDWWVQSQIDAGVSPLQFKYYTDYSIGFLTRGCFRQCKFCVNQKYTRVLVHSPLEEFLDPERKKICLLDDNFFGCPQWSSLLQELIGTGKPFQFKQGLDERLLTDPKCELLFKAKYDGDYIFAFDNVEDYPLIEEKLQMIRRYTDNKHIKFYVLCGFKSTDVNDVLGVLKRMYLLGKYNCLPYIMRYQGIDSAPWKESPHRGMYITLARYCNQPSLFRKKTLWDFAEINDKLGEPSTRRYLTEFQNKYPDIANNYFNRKFGAMYD